jgi:hypothetical protein
MITFKNINLNNIGCSYYLFLTSTTKEGGTVCPKNGPK